MRRLLVFLLCWLSLTHPVCEATSSILFAGSNDNLNPNATEYLSIMGPPDAVWNNTSTRNRQTIPAAGNLTNLRVVVTADPGAGATWSLAVMVAGSASALNCTISAGSTSCQDTDSVAVTAGQEINVRMTPSATDPAAADGMFSVEFQSTTAKESWLLSNSGAGTTAATHYSPLGAAGGQESTITDVETVMATSGTIKDLHCGLDSDPGAGNTHTCTIMLDGSTTALTCTVVEGQTDCTDLSNSFAVVAGSRIVLRLVHSVGAVANEIEAGVTFVSDTEGEHMVMLASDDSPSTSAAEYLYLSAGGGIWNADETVNRSLGQAGSISGAKLDALYVDLETAPGAGDSYTFTVYQDGSPTGLSCAVTETGTTCNNGTDVTISDDDQFSVECVPSGTPTATNVRLGVLVSPASAATRRLWITN